MCPKNVSILLLSMQLPFLDMLCTIPFAFRQFTNEECWYCHPWSVWNTRPSMHGCAVMADLIMPITRFISADALYVELMTMRYIMFLRWDDIICRMGYAQNTVFRKHREALERIRLRCGWYGPWSFPTVWGEDGSMRLMRDHDGSCETSSDYRSSWRIGTDVDSLWGLTLVLCSSRGLIARCLGWSDAPCQPTNTQLLNSLPDSFLLSGVICFVG